MLDRIRTRSRCTSGDRIGVVPRRKEAGIEGMEHAVIGADIGDLASGLILLKIRGVCGIPIDHIVPLSGSADNGRRRVHHVA